MSLKSNPVKAFPLGSVASRHGYLNPADRNHSPKKDNNFAENPQNLFNKSQTNGLFQKNTLTSNSASNLLNNLQKQSSTPIMYQSPTVSNQRLSLVSTKQGPLMNLDQTGSQFVINPATEAPKKKINRLVNKSQDFNIPENALSPKLFTNLSPQGINSNNFSGSSVSNMQRNRKNKKYLKLRYPQIQFITSFLHLPPPHPPAHQQTQNFIGKILNSISIKDIQKPTQILNMNGYDKNFDIGRASEKFPKLEPQSTMNASNNRNQLDDRNNNSSITPQYSAPQIMKNSNSLQTLSNRNQQPLTSTNSHASLKPRPKNSSIGASQLDDSNPKGNYLEARFQFIDESAPNNRPPSASKNAISNANSFNTTNNNQSGNFSKSTLLGTNNPNKNTMSNKQRSTDTSSNRMDLSDNLSQTPVSLTRKISFGDKKVTPNSIIGLQHKGHTMSDSNLQHNSMNGQNEINSGSIRTNGLIENHNQSKNTTSSTGSSQLMGASAVLNSGKSIIALNAVKTKPGSLPGQPVKTNQDSYISILNYNRNQNSHFFGVCDGHGVNGHHASQFIKKQLPLNFQHFLNKQKINSDMSNQNSVVRQAMTQSFAQTNKDLLESGIDVTFSGSTTVVTYIHDNKIWCGNVGDSRATMARFNQNEWKTVPLSIDQKPDSEGEMMRIINRGGRVEPFKDYDGNPMGPHRVWLQTENIPGLAMARSFGDYVASQVGVISEPEIITAEIQEEDRFMVIASDGVWEFLSNEMVTALVLPFYYKNDPDGACDQIIQESVAAWKRQDEVVDDITVLLVFFTKTQKTKGQEN